MQFPLDLDKSGYVHHAMLYQASAHAHPLSKQSQFSRFSLEVSSNQRIAHARKSKLKGLAIPSKRPI